MTASQPAPAPPEALLLGEVQVQADRDGLARCLSLAASICQRLALADADAQAVRLAVEEACTNVVDHGYAHTTPGPIGLRFHLAAPDLLEALVDDQATPFHPDDVPAPDLSSDADDRPIGGLGWFFIRQTMTEVLYASNELGNRLTLRRRLASPVAAGSEASP